MTTEFAYKKGDRVRAGWLQVTNASLAGAQPKFGMVAKSVVGRITHIRGDHPTDPKSIGVWIQPDEGPEVVVSSTHILEVLESC